MATLPAGITQKELDRYAQLDAGLKKIAEEHKLLNEKIKQVHKDAGIVGKKTLTYVSDKYGAVVVDLNEQNRTDAAALEEAHPQAKFPDYYTVQFDASKVDAKVKAKFKKVVQTMSVKVSE